MKNLKTISPAGKLALMLALIVLPALAVLPFGCGKSPETPPPQAEKTEPPVAPEAKSVEAPSTPAPAAPVAGTNFDRFIPDNVYAYLSVDNIAKLSDAYKQSSLGKLWNDPEVKKFTEKSVELLQKEFTKNVTKETNISFNDITSLAEVFTGQAAFVLDRIELKNVKRKTTRLAFGADGQPLYDEETQSYKYEDVEIEAIEPVFYLMLMAEVAKNREKLDGLLEKITKSAADEGVLKKEESYKGVTYFTFYRKQESTNLSYGYMDNIFFVNLGDKALKRIIDAYKQPADVKPLSARPAYRKITAGADSGRIMTFYANIPPFISMIKSFIVKGQLSVKSQTAEELDEFNKKFDKVMDSCGLGELKSIVGAYRAEGGNFIAEGLIEMPGARKGLMAVFTGDPTAEFKTLKAVPADTMMYIAGSFSFAKLYDGIMDIVASVTTPEEYEKEVKSGIRETEEKLGLKIKEDILSIFGGEMAMFMGASKTPSVQSMAMGVMPFNMAFIVPIAKPEAVKNVHAQIVKVASESNQGKSPFVEKQYEGFTFYVMEMPDHQMEGQPPMPEDAREMMGYFFTKDMFVYAMPASTLKTVADALSGKGAGSLAADRDFTALLARNKVSEKSVVLSYTNLEKYLENMLSMFGEMMGTGMASGMSNLEIPDIEDDTEGDAEEGREHLAPDIAEDEFAKLMKELPKMDALKKYFAGCKAIGQLYPAPDGIMWRSFTRMDPE